jgi:hypothetical protein
MVREWMEDSYTTKCVCACVLSNYHYYHTHCLFIACVPLLLVQAMLAYMAMAVQDLPGDGASKVTIKIFMAMVISSSVLRW